MFEHRRFLLWCLVALLISISAILLWNFYFTSTAFFPAGTRPTHIDPNQKKPMMPALRETDPRRGSTSTDALVIVEFADYSCVFCRMAEATLLEVLPEYEADIQYVWRDTPALNDRPDSVIAAAAGRCAHEQAVFWPMRDALMNAPQLDFNSIKSLARPFMPKMDKFEQCLNSGKYIADIQADVEAAKKNNITKLPTIFVGETVLSGLITPTDLRWAIRKELLFKR